MAGTHHTTAIVTGGAGFLGSFLCEKLLARGQDVVCLDNFFTGRKRNIRHLMDNPDFELVRHDVTLPFQIEADAIYNLACPASPIHYQYDPVQTTKTSVLGAINMLELAKRTKASILQASTSEVYGDPREHPQREEYWGHVNPVGPRACYDEGKRCAETLMIDYRLQHGIDTRIVRIFNTYGPRMRPDDGRVISNFIVQALRNEPMTIYGNGNQTRSFCYVDDLVDGLIAMMEPTRRICGPVNLGNPTEISIRELAESIKDLIGSASIIEERSSLTDDPRQRCPDITKAKSELGWEPTTSLRDGLASTIAYFEQLLSDDDKLELHQP